MSVRLAQLIQKLGMAEADFKYRCDQHNLDWRFIAAICSVESGGDPFAVRYEPRYKWIYKTKDFSRTHRITEETEVMLQKMSWGPFQVMGALARELGYHGPLNAMVDASLNMSWALVHLMQLKRKHQTSDKIAAAYNAGKPRRKLLTGEFKNQKYVNKVLNRYEEFKAVTVS